MILLETRSCRQTVRKLRFAVDTLLIAVSEENFKKDERKYETEGLRVNIGKKIIK